MRIRHLLLVAVLIRILVIPFFYHPDLKSQYFHFQFFSQKIFNIYDHIAQNHTSLPYRDTFNYLPLTYFTFGSYYSLVDSIHIPGLQSWLNDWGEYKNSHRDLPMFLFILKLPYFICDFLIGYLLYKLTSSKKILFLWFLNPVSIYLIYILGNFDVLPVLLTLLSYYFLTVKLLPLSSFTLGIAIALKLYPLLFVPFFLLHHKSFKKIIVNAVIALLPLLVALIPFYSSANFWTSFLGSGLTQKILEFRILLIPVFPVFYALLLLLFFLKKIDFISAIVYLFLFFVACVNFHPQWLLWFFPFIILAFEHRIAFRIPAIAVFLLLFIYILLFNDEFLFWGHLVPIDPEFLSVSSPYTIFNKYSPLPASVIQKFIHYSVFIFTFIIWRKSVPKN